MTDISHRVVSSYLDSRDNSRCIGNRAVCECVGCESYRRGVTARDDEIRTRVRSGESVSAVAKSLGWSIQQVVSLCQAKEQWEFKFGEKVS